MLKSHKTRIRVIATVFGAGLLFIPISISPAGRTPVEVTDACADDTCCPEIGSVCTTDDGDIFNRYSSPNGCEVKQRNN